MKIKYFPRLRSNATLIVTGMIGLSLTAQSASAATQTGTATINANVVGACNVLTPSTLDFGTISSVGGVLDDAVDAQGTIAVACSTDAAYTVYLGDGDNRAAAGTGLRNMANGTNLLPYQIYKETGRTNVWDATGIGQGVNGAGGVTGAGTGASVDIPFFGRIAANTVLPTVVGAYADTVTITLAY